MMRKTCWTLCILLFLAGLAVLGFADSGLVFSYLPSLCIGILLCLFSGLWLTLLLHDFLNRQ